MSYRTIRLAQQATWPKVRESLALHRASRAALRDGAAPTAMAARDARKPWDRVVMEETVWAIAKANQLASPEAAEVIRAARAWAAVGPIGDDYGDDPEDIALYEAVQALVSTPSEVPDEKVLTDSDLTRTVHNNTPN